MPYISTNYFHIVFLYSQALPRRFVRERTNYVVNPGCYVSPIIYIFTQFRAIYCTTGMSFNPKFLKLADLRN